MNKTLLAPPLIISFRLIRVKIEEKYAVLHCATISACMCISTFICWLGLYLSLPIGISLISNIIVGVIFAIITWKIQEVIDMKAEYDKMKDRLETKKGFSTAHCTEEELIARCKELNFTEENTLLAIEFFIKKTKQSELANKMCVEEHAISTRKLRLKKKLNNIG